MISILCSIHDRSNLIYGGTLKYCETGIIIRSFISSVFKPAMLINYTNIRGVKRYEKDMLNMPGSIGLEYINKNDDKEFIHIGIGFSHHVNFFKTMSSHGIPIIDAKKPSDEDFPLYDLRTDLRGRD